MTVNVKPWVGWVSVAPAEGAITQPRADTTYEAIFGRQDRTIAKRGIVLEVGEGVEGELEPGCAVWYSASTGFEVSETITLIQSPYIIGWEPVR